MGRGGKNSGRPVPGMKGIPGIGLLTALIFPEISPQRLREHRGRIKIEKKELWTDTKLLVSICELLFSSP
jgi:hypothetical protein